ncbi:MULTISPECIES: IucA/IucC family protein [Streptomyces]|uniref:IucA/IucC family siderophore biosynthesis protein n=1 Tax=Streptomyces xinghaiensis TaxID=1038928 RepID=A0A3M8EUF7_9ACTN|nr:MULTISPECIES: IucA/IucC family siderophore biosynthesis protein [Streptomyces]PQM19450.1 IucA/IucC family protein [Streptomyces xinghaiensis]RKM92783.1 IucA/IucC family siderophore biosynthesis protein [Streptomyces xinghaiensis]RNC69126.1 IucA/IucC family siderophore biosynthesis protein [Streptomyces xinghaiensis]
MSTTAPHGAAAADATPHGAAPLRPAPHTAAPAEAVAHLTPGHWDTAVRLLIRKALAEFSHERLLTPEPLPGDRYRVTSDDGTVEYRFAARRMRLDHWHVDAASITRHRVGGTGTDEAHGTDKAHGTAEVQGTAEVHGNDAARATGETHGPELPLDGLAFFTELRTTLGIADDILPVYLEEIGSTLSGTAYKLGKPAVSAAELAAAGFQAIETGMTEGHPCFVANNGRLGFGIDDYHAHAPETGAPVRLLWLAAHRDHTTFTCSADTDYDTLLRAELGDALLGRFTATLTGLGLDPGDYLLIPVHPWQWWNKLSVTFAAEIAQRRLVCLGPGDDDHLAQQSIRTFFNTSDPAKHYVKTALSVLNMGFMRGLSAAYMEATPAINDWLAGLVARDPVLRRTGLTVIRERAAIGYRHRGYEAATDQHSPYRKMLAALWRESPVPGLRPGQRLATMAALLHTDRDGRSLTAALIERSGLTAEDWLRRYLDAYLTPLLHSFYAHDLAYMPHGENVILVLEDDAVARVVFKDIAEEIVVMNDGAELPPEVERVRAEVPEDMKLLSILTDVFDCFLRHLAAVLAAEEVIDEDAFWRTVAGTVTAYQESVPELADRFARYDIFAGEFALSCLNRLQLRNNRQMVDLQDPSGALQLVGTLENPIAAYAPAAAAPGATAPAPAAAPEADGTSGVDGTSGGAAAADGVRAPAPSPAPSRN